MSDVQRAHARFDELAAGYALHALDPADELEFVGHAARCPRCQQSLADYAEVTAALAQTAPAATPSADLADRILAAAIADSARGAAVTSPAGPDAPEPQVVALHRRRTPRRLQIMVAAAAAAVLIAVGAIWGGLAGGSGGAGAAGGPRPPAAGCAQSHQCTAVQLTDARSHESVATVIVSAGSVWLRPSGLAADNASHQVYVLWQLTGKHTPLAVGSFDVRRGVVTPIRIGGLAVSYHDTWAFAVSLEHGRTIPASPSRPVALGQVPA